MAVETTIRECEDQGFKLRRVPATGELLVHWEIRYGGKVIGLVEHCGLAPDAENGERPRGFMALTADAELLPGPFARVLDACRALADDLSSRGG